MVKKIYVGNLPYQVTDDDLFSLFSAHGQVVSAKVMVFKNTSKSKGFGFVEMATEEEADAAIEKLNRTEFEGRTLSVAEAKPMTENSEGGGGFRRSSPGSGDRGGYGGDRRSGGGGSGGFRSSRNGNSGDRRGGGSGDRNKRQGGSDRRGGFNFAR